MLKRGYSVCDMAITMRCSAFKRAKILIILKLCNGYAKTETKTRAGGQTHGRACMEIPCVQRQQRAGGQKGRHACMHEMHRISW